MKTTQIQQTPRRGLLAVLGINLALAASLSLTHAADRTWNGAGDGVTMSSGANWVGGVAPVNNDSLFFDGSTGLAPNNDLSAANTYQGITFNAGAGAFTISGNEIKLANVAGLGVTNNSPNPQTFAANFSNNGQNKVQTTTGADLIYGGTFKSWTINKFGTNAVWLMGTGNNDINGVINEGSIVLAKVSGNALQFSSTVNSNGTLRVHGPGTDQMGFNVRVTLNGGKFQVANTNGLVSPSFEEINGLTGANPASIVENGLADSTNRLILGGGFGGARGIYGGVIRDGAGVLDLRVGRGGNSYVFNGTHTYSGTTDIINNDNTGPSRIILNGTHVGGGEYAFSSSGSDKGAVLGGTGIISATVANFNANSFLAPGGSLASDANNSLFSETTGILTISNAVNLNDATATLDVQLNGTAVGSGYDQVNIAGSGSLSNNAANLKLTLPIIFTPTPGDKFTIVKVQGTDPANNVGTYATLNGAPTDLSQGATLTDALGNKFRISYRAEGSTFDAGAGLGNDIMLEALSSTSADLTWRGDVNNVWDISGTANWRDTNGVAATFADGDSVTFNDSGSNSVPVDITTALNPVKFLFNATKNYELAGFGSFNGTVVLTKTNTGTLTILTDNSNDGTTIIEQGTVRVGTNGTTGTLSGGITVNANGILEHSRLDDVTVNTAITGTGTLLHTGDGALILGGNSSFSGKTTNSGGLLQLGTGLDGGNGSVQGDIHVSGASVLRYLYAGDVTIGHTKSGNGTVIYEAATGNRTFNIPASIVNSNYTGSNYIAAGVRLKDTNPNSGYSLGNGGSVTVADSGQVYLETSTVPHTQEFFLQGNGWIGDPAPLLGALRIYQATIAGPVHLLADTRIGGFINGGTIIGKIDGAFQLEVLATATNFTLSLGPTNGPNTYASTLVTSGSIRALNSGGISSGPLKVDLIGVVHTFGNNVTVASLNNGGGGGGAIYNMSTTTNGTLTVGTDNTSTSFDGWFANGASQPLGLTKVGSGTLTLSGVSSNTGTVAVNGGTLALTGAGSFNNASLISVGSGAFYDVTLAGGTLTLNSGQTLGGNGTVTGNLVASAGSTIAPGASVGSLTVAGNVTLGGGMTMELNRSLSPNSDRLLTSGGSITGGGTLTTTNIGPALQVGDTFQLFASGVSGITANLQTVDVVNGVTYTWQNNLASSGAITVQSVTPIGQPTLNVSQAGNTLTFSWTGPFKLQAQTNSLAVGISNNWGNYPGGATSPVVVTINPSNPTVFFRLSLQ